MGFKNGLRMGQDHSRLARVRLLHEIDPVHGVLLYDPCPEQMIPV